MINAKHAKSLRRDMRLFLGGSPKVTYVATKTPQVSVPDYSRGLQANGLPHMKVVDGVTPVVLARGCQRFAYQQAKKRLASPAQAFA